MHKRHALCREIIIIIMYFLSINRSSKRASLTSARLCFLCRKNCYKRMRCYEIVPNNIEKSPNNMFFNLVVSGLCFNLNCRTGRAKLVYRFLRSSKLSKVLLCLYFLSTVFYNWNQTFVFACICYLCLYWYCLLC